eukprot:TRINITY_DN26185_c0_g1_i1.p1 TRINITY_DN26185_c0_g1~~TRINITY_DN26185_c0_g1_i1.p1  ORF type:complete len:531 (+),score=96.81 TRINITY_DN26185_c0_g1_i1:54-1646(+)
MSSSAMRGVALVVQLMVFLSSVLADSDSNIILPPTSNRTDLPEKMLLFIPGGKVPTSNYEATARAIQQAAASDIRLWVVVPAVFQRLCIITCSSTSLCGPLHSTVESALGEAVKKGWNRGKDEENMYIAGHSLGGVCANTLFQAYSSGEALPYAGIIVMGSYVDESGNYDLTHYPKPVFVLNTELDGGLARPGKTSIWWKQHLALVESQGEEYTTHNKPVVILPKLNHTNFCPGFDVPGDLPAEVDLSTATSIIGESVAAFLKIQIGGAGKAAAVSFLADKIAWTKKFMEGYLLAQQMERDVSHTQGSPEGTSSFCAKAQHIIAGLSDADDSKLSVIDGFHESNSNLEHCHPNWTVAEDKLTVRSCSHTDYYSDVANTGTITAASEIACKMLSADRVAQQLNTTVATAKVDCVAINKHAVKVAEGLAAPSTLARYNAKGRGWCFLPDAETFQDIGPLWVFKDALALKETDKCMEVTAASLKTTLDGRIYPGNHYCKVLSPARVLDWMMTDSLKTKKANNDVVDAGVTIVV